MRGRSVLLQISYWCVPSKRCYEFVLTDPRKPQKSHINVAHFNVGSIERHRPNFCKQQDLKQSQVWCVYLCVTVAKDVEVHRPNICKFLQRTVNYFIGKPHDQLNFEKHRLTVAESIALTREKLHIGCHIASIHSSQLLSQPSPVQLSLGATR